MKIIGITGKSGAGKTTLSELLASDEGTRIIHMDYILEPIKEKRIFKSITQNTKLQQNEDNMHTIVNPKLSDFLCDTKIVGKIYSTIRNLVVNRILNKKVEEAEKEGVKTLIIEGAEIRNLNVLDRMNMVIMLKTAYHIRLERVSKRDIFTDKTVLVKRDRRLKKNKSDILEKRKDLMVIENNGNMEQLQEKAKDILRQIEEQDVSPEKRFRKSFYQHNLTQNKTNENRVTKKVRLHGFRDNK